MDGMADSNSDDTLVGIKLSTGGAPVGESLSDLSLKSSPKLTV